MTSSFRNPRILSADDTHVIKWYVDTSSAMHPDFRSHTDSVMTYGKGVPISQSHKQKLNTGGSNKAEVLVGVDDAMGPILWIRLFFRRRALKCGTIFCTRTIRVLFFWRTIVRRA